MAVYSERLGDISDAQFAAATARLGVGAFISANSISTGLFGQNVFLTTTAGEFVFRGAPHWVRGPGERDHRPQDRHQFTKEAFYADQLHQHTAAPVAWPYRQDQASDIFGWPYLIMPRMPGACFNERSIRKALGDEDRRAVALALGTMLAELQRLSWPFAGDFDVDTIELAPDPDGPTYPIAALRRRAAETLDAGAMTGVDMAWIDEIATAAEGLDPSPVTFVHGDYKLDNLTVANDGGGWRVSGIFDLHTARFGDGAYDLVRAACAWLDTEPALARVFIDTWRAEAGDTPDPAPWMPVHVLLERLMIWQFAAGARPEWIVGKTFRGWVEPYLSRLLDQF